MKLNVKVILGLLLLSFATAGAMAFESENKKNNAEGAFISALTDKIIIPDSPAIPVSAMEGNPAPSTKPPAAVGQASLFLKAKIAHGKLLKYFNDVMNALTPQDTMPDVFTRLEKYTITETRFELIDQTATEKEYDKIEDTLEKLNVLGQALTISLKESQQTAISAESILSIVDSFNSLDVTGPAMLYSHLKEYLQKARLGKENIQELLNRVPKMSRKEQKLFQQWFYGNTMEFAAAHAEEQFQELSADLRELEALDSALSPIVTDDALNMLKTSIQSISEALEEAAALAV